jgi:hypothetical protein
VFLAGLNFETKCKGDFNEMKHSKKYLWYFGLLVVLSIAAFFLYHNNPQLRQVLPSATSQQAALPDGTNDFLNRVSHNAGSQQQPVDVWRVWMDKQVELQTDAFLESVEKERPYYLASAESQVDAIKLELREAFERKAEEFKQGATEPPSIKVYDFSELDLSENHEETETLKHEGPQTVEALLGSFEEVLVYPGIDGMYPQSEWVEMLLDRGIVIKDFTDYSGYLSARQTLVYFENNPAIWQSGEAGILPTEDWETFKASFIDRHIWQYEHIKAAKASDPEVTGGFFVGPEQRTFLPFKPGRVYVSRFEGGAFFYGESLTAKQEFELLCKGIQPRGYDIVYIDENDAVLSGAPPPITHQEFERMDKVRPAAQHPLDTPTHAYPKQLDDFADTFSESSQPTAAEAQTLKSQQEKRRIEFLEKLTKSDAERERLSTSKLQELLMDNPIEGIFPKELDPQHFEKAFATLQKYGVKEGMQRLRKTDQSVAAELERIFLSSQRSNMNKPRRLETDSPIKMR